MIKNQKPAITAIGTANPRYVQGQKETADVIASGMHLNSSEKKRLKAVYRATGIQTRYSVLGDYCQTPGNFEFFPNNPGEPFPSTAKRMKIYKDNALDLALSAIKNCLSQHEQFNKQDITHLITVSCTGMYAPGIDIEIVQQLQLNPSTKRTTINFMGCYGAFNGLKVAEAICKAEANANVLVVCIELCTIHFQRSMHLDNLIANSIFADGAAAVLVQSQSTQKKYFTLDHFHNDLLPQTEKEMAWQIGDDGFDIVLSSYVADAIRSGIATFFKRLTLDKKIDFYAIHPGGIKILQACEDALNITKEDNKYSYQVLKNFGNMSSATVLFVLKTIWDGIKPSDHEKNIFSCAFGPGLTLESMVLKTHNA